MTRHHSSTVFALATLMAGAVATGAQAGSARVVINPVPGYSITWDGNNGGFSSPDPGAGPSNNVALASNGTVAFSSGDLGPELGIPFHVAANLNDGLYGNINSWISGSQPGPYAALRFPASVPIQSIAWGRDNGLGAGDSCGGTCTDRAVGIYTLQFTQVAGPDGTTPETEDAATGWATIGTVQYLAGPDDPAFTSYLRHRFDVAEGGSAIVATGMRIKVSVGGIGGGLAIDEIEVNPPGDTVPPIGTFVTITPEAGFGVSWDRNEGNFGSPSSPAPAPASDAAASNGALAFGSSELGPALGLPFHRFANLNDGRYGNAYSWIANFVGGDSAPFVGINFGRRRAVSSIAWGRDNGDVAGDCCGGTLTDRALGRYVIQVTTVPNPGPTTPEACGPTPDAGWVTVGTIDYKANNPAYFNSHLRHRFDVSQGGAPIAATGIRIKVPDANTAIDEIEVNSNLALEVGAVRLTAAPDVTLAWDGNDGQFNNPGVGAAPPANAALATSGAVAFTSSDLGPLLGLPFHVAGNLNDGLYGNANSWISANGIGGATDPEPFAGVRFGAPTLVTNIAWGRDNGNVAGDCCGGTLVDRSLDTYRLQFTQVAAPDGTTPETGDAGTGWQDLGTVVYSAAAPPSFTPHLRHRFDLLLAGAPIEATGMRIKVGSGSTAIDEIEVNSPVGAPPPPSPVGLAPATGYSIAWDGNDGQFQNPAAGARPPANRALASQGSTAFTSSDLGPVLGISFHVAANLNDGLYGNAKAWISGNGIGGSSDPAPFAGIRFNGLVGIRNVAWSRDNGDAAEGNFTDRALGTYTLQVTTIPGPDSATPDTGDAATGWATVGRIEYRRAEAGVFTPHLRHRFDLSAAGQPVMATGLRILVSDGLTAIDEIEVNTATAPSGCCNQEPSFALAGSSTTSEEDAGLVVVPNWVSNLSPGVGEAGQTLTLHVSNDQPALFAVQPSISASGELRYAAVPGASGTATVSVFVTDDGGTGVCGDDTSATATFRVEVRAVNDCPSASAGSLALLQDGSVPVQLTGSDPDGEALRFEVTAAPRHGVLLVDPLTGSGTYTPAAGFCGRDEFAFRVTDGVCASDPAVVTVVVTCVNRCPVAVATAGPSCELYPESPVVYVIASNNTNACVRLSASGSSDPDGDRLSYRWFPEGSPVPLAEGELATACLEVGQYRIVLVATDGRCDDVDQIELEVITPAEAVDVLIAAVNDADLERRVKRPLIASLKAAGAAFDRGSCGAGVNQLQSFQNKIRAQLRDEKASIGSELMELSAKILACIQCPEPTSLNIP